MEYCKYHPLEAATYSCEHCQISHCDRCAGDTNRHGQTVCHFCERPMQELGTGAAAEPFWRRLQEAFRYPLNSNALPIILIVSLGTTVLMSIPFFWMFSTLLWLGLTGAMLKYTFQCLERTAAGEMSAPNSSDAFFSGIPLLLKLLLLIIVLSAAIVIVNIYLPRFLAGLIGTLVVISLPAIIIRFAQSEEILDALNPLHTMQLILAIGLPYGVLIGFIMIMSGSVGAINALLGNHSSMLTNVLQSVVSNYYMVVVFHLMGYMLYQYQHKLGFTARADNLHTERSLADILSARIDIHIKEGNYDKAIETFIQAIGKLADDKTLAQRFFDFSCAIKRKSLIQQSAKHYFNVLIKQRDFDRLNIAFTTANRLVPGTYPEDPATRLHLAKACRTKGDPQTAIHLLNGLHKTHPQFSQLHEAYLTLADALEEVNKHEHAEKCRMLANRLKKTAPTSKPEKPINPFAARELSAAPTFNTPAQPAETIAPPAQDQNSDKPKELPPIEFK